MRTSCIASGFVLILAVSASSGEAAILPFSGTLSVITGVRAFSTTTTGSGTGTSAGPGGAANIPANIFAINASGLISPAFSVLTGFAVCQSGITFATALTVPSSSAACAGPATNNALSFAGTTGSGGLNWSAYFTGTISGINFSTLGEIPLGVVGVGGSTTGAAVSLLGGGVVATFTIAGNPWTTNAVTSSGVDFGGTTLVLTAAGFDNRDASGQGTLQLVTPATLTLQQQSTVVATVPIVSAMTLTFVPEPSTALLLGSGIAGLVVLGRRRMRE